MANAKKKPPSGKRLRTRTELIEAASAVISEKGFDRASLEEIAARAGMTRGAVYGNFKNKEELFLAVIETQWKPILPPFKPGASLKEMMHLLGTTVAKVAQERQKYAALATAFQLYTLTHKPMQAQLTRKNAAAYQWIAQELVKVIPAEQLPMAPNDFVCVLDVITTGLLFTYFQTPHLITEKIFVATYEALTP